MHQVGFIYKRLTILVTKSTSNPMFQQIIFSFIYLKNTITVRTESVFWSYCQTFSSTYFFGFELSCPRRRLTVSYFVYEVESMTYWCTPHTILHLNYVRIWGLILTLIINTKRKTVETCRKDTAKGMCRKSAHRNRICLHTGDSLLRS
jgi:hypothetical protein